MTLRRQKPFPVESLQNTVGRSRPRVECRRHNWIGHGESRLSAAVNTDVSSSPGIISPDYVIHVVNDITGVAAVAAAADLIPRSSPLRDLGYRSGRASTNKPAARCAPLGTRASAVSIIGRSWKSLKAITWYSPKRFEFRWWLKSAGCARAGAAGRAFDLILGKSDFG